MHVSVDDFESSEWPVRYENPSSMIIHLDNSKHRYRWSG